MCRDYLQLRASRFGRTSSTRRELLHEALRSGKGILFEAAQGSLLDVDHGTYPYVTSSNSSTAGVWSGSGVPARSSIASSASSRPIRRASAVVPSRPS